MKGLLSSRGIDLDSQTDIDSLVQYSLPYVCTYVAYITQVNSKLVPGSNIPLTFETLLHVSHILYLCR